MVHVLKIRTGYKNLRRYKQIAKVLVKYGFDFFVEKLVEKGLVPSWIIRKPLLVNDLPSSKRLRLVLEELGPTFIKLGQILSTRGDILSEDIINELSKLQDNVPGFSYEIVEKLFFDEFGISIDHAFERFNKIPIAAASIGQVHEARLHNGIEVVVKIQRPNIDSIIKRDIDILCSMSKIFDDYFEDQMPFKMKDIAEEFAISITRELDYTHEGRNAEKFRLNFKDSKEVLIPTVIWKFTSRKILTLEKIQGIKVAEFIAERSCDGSIKEIGNLITRVFMKQVFIHGLFHGDPHPGNIFILPDKRIAFIDFGITGYLDNHSMTFITDLLIAGAQRDVDKILDLLIEIDGVTEETLGRRVKEDISFLLEFYFYTPLDRLNMNEAISELLKVTYRNKIKLPSQFTLLAKAILTLEGCLKKMNPELSISDAAQGFINEIAYHRLQPQKIVGEIMNFLQENVHTLRSFPKSLKYIIKKIERNEIKFNVEYKNIQRLEYQIFNSSNKISFSLLISSVILGSSLLLKDSIGPLLWDLSLIGLMGYLLAFISTILFLIFNIRRE